MKILRRLGQSPRQRKGPALCWACMNCPDVFELETGDFIIIGEDVTDVAAKTLPDDAGCGEQERIIQIPRSVFLQAVRDLGEASP